MAFLSESNVPDRVVTSATDPVDALSALTTFVMSEIEATKSPAEKPKEMAFGWYKIRNLSRKDQRLPDFFLTFSY